MAIPIQPSAIEQVKSAPIYGMGLTAVGPSTDVSSSIATILNTAGNNGVPVPVQVSTGVFVEGLITVPPLNRVQLRNAATLDPIRNGAEEVYGRITASGSVYTLSYFSNDAGVETPYNFATSTNINFLFPYRFSNANYPADALIAVGAVLLNPDERGSTTVARPILEAKTIATINTIPDLVKTPSDGALVKLIVNGVSYSTLTPNPVFSIAGKALTWIPSAGVGALPVGSDVLAEYFTFEAA
jgi:hypothetical protein